MKFFTKTSVLLIAGLVLLTGCGNLFARFTQPTEFAVKTTTCDLLKLEEFKQDCIKAADETPESFLYKEILVTFDSDRCDELSKDTAKDCKNYIKNTGIQGPITGDQVKALTEAINQAQLPYEINGAGEAILPTEESYDKTKCVALNRNDLQQYCEKKLDEKIENLKLLQILQTNDGKRCDELKNEILKRRCQLRTGTATE
jgi:hypothetical protein